MEGINKSETKAKKMSERGKISLLWERETNQSLLHERVGDVSTKQ
jgi:hypothetical protein